MQDRYRRPDDILLRRTAGPYIGSIASIWACPHHVCYSPHRDRTADIQRCPLSTDCVAKVESCGATNFSRKHEPRSDRRFRMASIALPMSPVNLTRGDEVPHIFTRKPRLRPFEFLITSAKRLLQHNRHKAADPGCPLFRCYRGKSRPSADMAKSTRMTLTGQAAACNCCSAIAP